MPKLAIALVVVILLLVLGYVYVNQQSASPTNTGIVPPALPPVAAPAPQPTPTPTPPPPPAPTGPCSPLGSPPRSSPNPAECIRKMWLDAGCKTTGATWPTIQGDAWVPTNWWANRGTLQEVQNDMREWKRLADTGSYEHRKGCLDANTPAPAPVVYQTQTAVEPCAAMTQPPKSSPNLPACLRKLFLQAGCRTTGDLWPSLQDGRPELGTGWWSTRPTLQDSYNDMKEWARLAAAGSPNHRPGCYGN